MNQRLHLLNRRRNTVLVSRHVRAVSLRHVPYRYVETKQPSELVEQNAVAEEKVEEIKEEKPVSKEEKKPILKEIKKEETKEKKPKKTRKEKKAQKAKDKEDRLNRLIDEPTNSVSLIFSNPLLCMERVGRVDYATLSTGQRIVLNVIKWLSIGYCIGLSIGKFINVDPFGFARMNFTSTANLSAKIAVYGFFFEILGGYLISAINNATGNSIDRARMVSVCSIAAPFKVLMFVNSAALLEVYMPIGIACFVCASVLSIMLTAFGLSKTKLSPRRTVFVIALVIILATVLFGGYFSLLCKDVVEILENIMNI